jgi:uncharacterized protein
MAFELLVVQPTSLCNLNCSYCYVPERLDKTKLETTYLLSAINNILQAKANNEILEILWHAGEPLAIGIKKFEEYLNGIDNLPLHNGRIKYSIQTNGTLLNEKWAGLLAKYDFSIGVSIDGPKFLNDEKRQTWGGKGTYDKTMQGIQFLRNAGLEPGIIMVISKDSIKYPTEIFSFLKENNFMNVGFNVEEVENNNKESSLNSISQEDFKLFLSQIYDLWESDSFAIDIREFSDIIRSIKNLQEDKSYRKEPLEVRELGILSLDKNGRLSVFSPELAGTNDAKYFNFSIGDYNTALINIKETDSFKALKKPFEESIRTCSEKCEYYKLCGGGFFSNKYYENGVVESTETTACRHRIKFVTDVLLTKLI